MRLSCRLLTSAGKRQQDINYPRQERVLVPPAGAPNQNVKAMWQDPVHGYWEQHGKMEFKPGEAYGLDPKEKELVLHRYRVKEILKKEFLRREYDPLRFRYKDGIIMDPAMFRWYAADMSIVEHFRYTPRFVFWGLGVTFGVILLYTRLVLYGPERADEMCRSGEIMWWDRTVARYTFVAGDIQPAPAHLSTTLI